MVLCVFKFPSVDHIRFFLSSSKNIILKLGGGGGGEGGWRAGGAWGRGAKLKGLVWSKNPSV